MITDLNLLQIKTFKELFDITSKCICCESINKLYIKYSNKGQGMFLEDKYDKYVDCNNFLSLNKNIFKTIFFTLENECKNCLVYTTTEELILGNELLFKKQLNKFNYSRLENSNFCLTICYYSKNITYTYKYGDVLSFDFKLLNNQDLLNKEKLIKKINNRLNIL